MNLQRPLAVGALALMLLSSAGGLVHGLNVGHGTLLGLREQQQPAFTLAARGNLDAARPALDRAIAASFRHVRVIDAHTHVIKLASLAMLLAFLLPLLPLGGRGRNRVAAGFLCGAILFPGGVLMQVWMPGLVFQSVAALGALLVIAAMGMTVLGVFRMKGKVEN